MGRQLAERYTANRARLGEPLEVIKFICKEFWADVFRKQVRTHGPSKLQEHSCALMPTMTTNIPSTAVAL